MGRSRSGRLGSEQPGADGPPGDPEAVARLICLRQLTLAPRTRSQLAVLLRSRGIPDEAAERVLSRFADVGLVDDEAFARAWVSSRHRTRGLAGRVLGAELHRRGVDPDIAREAVAELDPFVEAATARALVARKALGMARLDRATATRRLVGMLGRKGYPAGLAYSIVTAELEGGSARESPADSTGDPFDADGSSLVEEDLDSADPD